MHQILLAPQLLCAIYYYYYHYYYYLVISQGVFFHESLENPQKFAKIIHKRMVFDTSKLIKQKCHTFTRVGIDEDCKEKKNVHLQNFKNKLKIETSFLFHVLYS